MNTNERRRGLAEQAAIEGELSFERAAALFGVSPMTIRRDVEFLEQAGLARRIPGGMIPITAPDQPFASRVLSQAHEKEDIAKSTVELLLPGECVLIDSGSTALAVAKAICGRDLGLTVVTPSLLAAMALSDEPDTAVVLPGGELRGGELCLVGPETISALDKYNIDTFIMGVGGVDAERGISDYDRDEAAKKRAAVNVARRTIVCIDASKLGLSYASNVARFDQIQTLVTDGPSDHAAIAAARAAGVEVHLAGERGARTKRG